MNLTIAVVHVCVMIVMIINRTQAMPTPIGNTNIIDSTTKINPKNIDDADAVDPNPELEVKPFTRFNKNIFIPFLNAFQGKFGDFFGSNNYGTNESNDHSTHTHYHNHFHIPFFG